MLVGDKVNEEPKQETLEEVAKRIYPINIVSDGYDTNMLCRTGFYIGYELGQERSYSEEEAGELVYNIIGEYGKNYGIMIDGAKLNELFEQFKKQ